jgi:serine/threonine-protein kinase HipA
MELDVFLGDRPVGTIRAMPDGRTEFAFRSDYLSSDRRPVLGQYFEDHLEEVHYSRTHLPRFFSNLLPEGGLRELVARRAGVHPDREAHLIAVLGDDLPGAVIVRPASLPLAGASEAPDSGAAAIEAADHEEPLRFSLAGAQLKFSVLYGGLGRGPTVPVDGRGGNWIAKLPSESYEHLPENEFAMINWAGRVGIRVPEVELVRASEIKGLPVEIDGERRVFLSRRFDRPNAGTRIHQEDFVQVRNLRRDDRYGGLGHTGLARIVRTLAGDEDFDEVIRRTVFNILIGNGDAHLKNWSLVYPDGIAARLSPAYDLVAVITYIPSADLALKIEREKRFDRIRLGHFERLADKVAVPKERVAHLVRDTIKRAMDTWPKEDELEAGRAKLLRAHVQRLPLLDEVG